MKIKHYLTKAERIKLENRLNFWYGFQQYLTANNYDEKSIIDCIKNKLEIIDFITECGFKVIHNDKTLTYKITK